MSTLTTPAVPTTRAARPAYRVTGLHVLRSEWTKLWSLRSTWITLGLGLVFLVAFGLISAARYQANISSGQRLDPDFADATALSLSLFGTIQPGPLARYLKGAASGDDADGFMPRFQILVYPDPSERFVNVVRLTGDGQVDERLRDWLAEAYQDAAGT